MREADSLAGLVLRARAAEQVEDALVIARIDAAAVVLDLEHGANPVDAAPHDDPARPARLEIFDRILDQVRQDLVDRQPIGVSLGISHFKAGYETARYVLSRGYRRIGFVGHNIEDDRYALRRHDGFAACLAESGLAFVAEHLIDAPYEITLGKSALAALLAQNPDLDAVYFSNDAMAVGGYFHCIAQGIAVPEKLALVGFNGTDMGQALPLPLTSVLSKRYELGLLAGRSALALIAGREVPRVVDVGFDLLRGATA